ncbi:scaffolding protein [Microbacterium phage Mercedes]|nr:scaffolding protein [Microbacterium phage Mercedes]
MAPETQEQQNNGSAEGTSGQEQQGQQAPPEGTSGTEGQQGQAPVIDKSTRLPDDHPLIVSYGEVKEKLAKQATELTEARAQSARATQLEEELGKRPTMEAMEQLQNRHTRLEEFVQAIGLGKALDSRTFTRDLFETDKDIKTLVREYNQANPSATAAALSGTAGGSAEGTGKHNPNDLLRIAAGKK